MAHTTLFVKIYLTKICGKVRLVSSESDSVPFSKTTSSPVYSEILGNPTLTGRSAPTNNTKAAIISETTDDV